MTYKDPALDQLSLGKTVEYIDQYAPHLLQAVPRKLNRESLNIVTQQPFTGVDLWTGYELSWLNLKGKPCVAILTASVPYSSPNIVESKSFKLYLNSFNQSQFEHFDEVKNVITKDLSACAGVPVDVQVYSSTEFQQFQLQELPGVNLDDLDISVDCYNPDRSILTLQNNATTVTETLNSHLLKSNCLITHQPDWASIAIRYQGPQIDHASLLRYLISFRQHNEFHEQCVERIFCDIKQLCQPNELSVYARYTRRGGLDINPFRSNFESCWGNIRLARQ
ncbi:NADPH-dependent 7-cyano-7-deazaguanine reductase QueF [Alteromonadaceae bacterium BrNp21-10]|nr:NADPH-dependent 7-cyano-7-deazaguanine reductase QueF [Alteromonadaceae bacterium BrNp21-10]